jgi:hypothetical protein
MNYTEMKKTITNIPKTVLQLENWMKEYCFNFSNYSINGNVIYEGFGIDKSGGLFIWYYTERGEKRELNYFQSEEKMVEYAYEQIKSDKWANVHCIGLNIDKNESEELAKRLLELKIDFFQDEIPYYGPHKPAYRTFVRGCDTLKVSHLKEKYYKEKC